MVSLSRTCAFPLAMPATMRGEWGEFKSRQKPAGFSARAHPERRFRAAPRGVADR